MVGPWMILEGVHDNYPVPDHRLAFSKRKVRAMYRSIGAIIGFAVAVKAIRAREGRGPGPRIVACGARALQQD